MDDERSICELLEIALRKDGHKVETVQSGDQAKRKVNAALFDVIVTDIKMPNTNGIEVLRYAHTVSPDTAVVLITAVDDLDAAVQAVKAGGAFDYIRKGPALVEDVKFAIGKAMDKLSLRRQNLAYKRDAASRNSLDNLVGIEPGDRKAEADHPHHCADQQHGADPRRERHRQGTGGARRPCLLHRAPASPSCPSTAAPFPRPCWKANCSDT